MQYEILIRYQPLPIDNIDNKLYACPITGTIDNKDLPIDTAIREVEEESGYVIKKSNIITLGKYIVGTQTNEIVHMFAYILNENQLPEKEIYSDGIHEAISKNKWKPLEFLTKCRYSACNIGYLKLINILT